MITQEEAYARVLMSAVKGKPVAIDFMESTGFVLAEPVYSDMDMPPFDKSAVDGFACRKADLPGVLHVVETIAAGATPTMVLAANQCSRIMTGAMLPKGADTVVMVEDVKDADKEHVIIEGKAFASNIAAKAEDIKVGDLMLEVGTLIKPQHIAVMAAVGHVKPTVYAKPTVAIISTGNELVEPWVKPEGPLIRNSNAYQLMAQVAEMNVLCTYFGIALDTPQSTEQVLKKAILHADVSILTGGVSMGDFDYVPAVLNSLGIQIQFKSIAVQPGRPTVFGTKDGKYFFGLPGNPVSSFVQFNLLVRPLLLAMSGAQPSERAITLPMGTSVKRKKAVRKSFFPVKIIHNKVFPVDYHGSAHINAYTKADGMVAFDSGIFELTEGTLAHVRLL